MKLFIAMPCYGGNMSMLTAKSLVSLSALLTEKKIDFEFFCIGNEALISRARNYCVDTFLQTNATHLMFIDSDIVFRPADVLRLAEHKKSIVGALYPRKTLNGGLVGDDDYIGTGFVLIERQVFETLRTPDLLYTPDHIGTDYATHKIAAYFDTGIVGERYLSEDYLFCHRARKAGIELYLDKKIKLSLVKT